MNTLSNLTQPDPKEAERLISWWPAYVSAHEKIGGIRPAETGSTFIPEDRAIWAQKALLAHRNKIIRRQNARGVDPGLICAKHQISYQTFLNITQNSDWED